MAMAKPKAMAI